MNAYERFALGHYLCEIPEGKTFGEVLEMVVADDVYVWQPFERYEREELAEKIEDMRDALFGTFIPREPASNPYGFTHEDTVILYDQVFADQCMEAVHPDCFPGYQQEMPLDEAWEHFYEEDDVYQKCKAELIKRLIRETESFFPALSTANVSYKEMAEHMLAYWTEILSEQND
jgi:hypothetical protein